MNFAQGFATLVAASALLAGCAPSAPRELPPALATSHAAPAPLASAQRGDAAPPTSPPSAAAAANAEEEDMDACPKHAAEPSHDSPSYVVDDLGELYSGCVMDYLDVFGQGDQPIVDIGPANRRRAVCAALGSEGYAVFERAQSGKPFKTRAPEACVGLQKQEFRMGRIIWEFSKLPNGKYLVTRTARSGSPIGLSYQGHSITTSLDGSFVVTVVASSAWRCPHDPSDPCELSRDEQNPGAADEVRCAGDEVTLCAPAGVTSDVYVTDYRTRATSHFGWFSRRPAPSVAIDSRQVVVTAGECTQVAPLPLVAAE